MYGNNGSRKQSSFALITALVITLLAQPAFSENIVDDLSQGGNGGGDPNAAGGEAAASKIAAGMVADPNAVIDSTQTNKSMGREQKAADGASQSGTGKGVAIGTGAALMATAIPMLISIDPLTRATGAALMAKSGLEFAQAAADGGTQSANKKQEDLLRANSDQNIDQAMKAANDQGKKEVQNQVANAVAGNAELQKVLGQNGVNADDFAKNFASGGLLSPEAILAATGSAAVDPGSMAQGMANANKEPLGNQSTITAIQEDGEKENNGKRGENSSGGGSGASAQNGSGQPAGANKDLGRGLNGGTPDGLAGLISAASKGGSNVLDGIKNASDGELASMLAGLMGMGGAGAKTDGTADAKRVMDKEALAKKGILPSTGKPGIFMLARRNYRSFQKWRRNTTVAANHVR